MEKFHGDVSNDKNISVPRYVSFRRELTHVKYSFKKIRNYFQIPKGIIKKGNET